MNEAARALLEVSVLKETIKLLTATIKEAASENVQLKIRIEELEEELKALRTHIKFILKREGK